MAKVNPLAYTGRVKASADRQGDAHFNSSHFSVSKEGKVSAKATAIATSYATDSGSATPASNAVTFAGGEGIDVSGSGATVTIAGEDATSANKGIASFAAAEFDVSSGAVSLADEGIRQDFFDYDYVNAKFHDQPIGHENDGTAASGTTGATNVMHVGDGIHMEYHIKGTQTILIPQISADGLDIGMDATENDGVELSLGITARSRCAFTAQTDACFVECTVALADSSAVDPFYIGFRKAEAYQAAIGSYADYFVLGVEGTANPNKIQFQTNLNAGGAATTDSTDTWADAASKTIRINVSAAGVATGLIDGVAPTTEPAAFTFDSGDVLIPFIYFLRGSAPSSGAVTLTSFKCGLQ